MYYGSCGEGLSQAMGHTIFQQQKLGVKQQRQEIEVPEDAGLSESEMSWAQNVFGDINIAQYSLDDEFTPIRQQRN